MVNKKELEILNEILLRMSYDLSKTLNENKSLLKESAMPTPQTYPNLAGRGMNTYYYDKSGKLKGGGPIDLNRVKNEILVFASDQFPTIKDWSTYPESINPFSVKATSWVSGPPMLTQMPSNTSYWRGKPFPSRPVPYNGSYYQAAGSKSITPPVYRYNNNLMNVGDANRLYEKHKELWALANVGQPPGLPVALTDDPGGARKKLIDKYVDYHDYLKDLEENPNNYNITSIGPYMKKLHEYKMKADLDYRNNYNLRAELERREELAYQEISNIEKEWSRYGPDWASQRDNAVTPQGIIDRNLSQARSGILNKYQIPELRNAVDTPEKRAEAEGSGVHGFLMWTSIIAAGISLLAATILSGGVLSPALAAFAGYVSLGADIVDAGIYAYEGNYREAGFTLLLGSLEIGSIRKALKSANVTDEVLQGMRDKANKYADELVNGTKKLDDILTPEELKLFKEIEQAAPKLVEGTKLAKLTSRKLAVEGFVQTMAKSPKLFLKSLFKLKTYGLAAGLFLTIDGVQFSYNKLYNGLTNENKDVQFMTVQLIKYMLGKEDVKNQIEGNALELKPLVENASDEVVTKLFGEVINFEDITEEQALAALETYMNQPSPIDNSTIVSGAQLTYEPNTAKNPVPFKNKEEGDAFRKWFRENPAYEYWANLWEIDETGPYNNTYIKKAYNLIAGGKTAGEFYKEYLENPTVDAQSSPPVSE
jgi:hypothetical protein